MTEVIKLPVYPETRTKWDIRFLQMARFVSSWSKDPSTKTGAVIVRGDRSIASVGFNGFPRNMYDLEERYADRKEKYSRIIHCEINAMLHANGRIDGCTLYTWPFACCDRCVVQMLEVGICRFVFPSIPEIPELIQRWQESLDRTKSYMAEAGVLFTEIPMSEIPE